MNEGEILKKRPHTLYCSFCPKSQQEVRKLIAGPSVMICDECIELSGDILFEVPGRDRGPSIAELLTIAQNRGKALTLDELADLPIDESIAILRTAAYKLVDAAENPLKIDKGKLAEPASAT